MSVARSLLLLCREGNGTADQWASLPPDTVHDRLLGAQAEAAALLAKRGAGLSAFAGRDEVLALRDLAVRWLDELSEVNTVFANALVAHPLAMAVSEAAGDTFVEWFRSRVTVEVVADEPYPVGSYDPRPFLGDHKPNTQPRRLPDRELDHTPRLRLGDQATSRYGLTLDFDCYHHLARLAAAPSLRLAAVQPNLSLAEFDIDAAADGRAVVRNHGPRVAERQRVILASAISAAAGAGAQVVVVPEYCLDEAGRASLRADLEAMDDRPALVVGGTSEVRRDGSWIPFNEAYLAVPDLRGLGIYKTFPAEVQGAVEDIAVSARVTVFWTETWVFTVLICRDAASPDLVDVLGRAGVNLLLVPAFSDRTGSLVDNARSLRTRSQAFVVVANAPAAWTWDALHRRPEPPDLRVEAAFDGPYEHPPEPVLAPDHHDGSALGAGVWLYDAGERKLSWIELDVNS